MEELQKIKIKMEVTNQYGDRFAIEQEVDEEFTEDDGEMGVYHNAYLSFLKTAGFCFNLNDRIIVLKENEFVDTYCEEDYCDGDCDNCYID